uniref:U1-poneritoxin-Da1a n=1 Tax=Dinoponera australis TaxID=609289 RepID=TX1A_DINAS|nr:RecName: Full=U1-poneritoxin-Da1a; Short=U1-PONTX-Da1a; AltName: Full=Dinoponeratoxin Da-1039; AltName: Full=Poneratoxin [Dinoponera australis]
GVVPHDFRI